MGRRAEGCGFGITAAFALCGVVACVGGCGSRTVPVDAESSDLEDNTQASEIGGELGTAPADAWSEAEAEAEDDEGVVLDWQSDPPDLPGADPQCDVWDPDACPEGEKCLANHEGGIDCVWCQANCRPIVGDADPGELCESSWQSEGMVDTCAKGSICAGLGPEPGTTICLALCTGSPEEPQCPDGSGCANATSLGPTHWCLPTCDPLMSDCTGSHICVPDELTSSFLCVLDASGGMAPYGTPCNYVNSCNAGLFCVDAAGVPEPGCDQALGCCSPACDTGMPNSCPGVGQLCEAWFPPGEGPAGLDHVGVCAVP